MPKVFQPSRLTQELSIMLRYVANGLLLISGQKNVDYTIEYTLATDQAASVPCKTEVIHNKSTGTITKPAVRPDSNLAALLLVGLAGEPDIA